ncbi:MAG: hypothetical protein JXB50_06990, partial [Spirochaetes bacterium]|nr:hypothetical protein [Spirochaetota bacterium]
SGSDVKKKDTDSVKKDVITTNKKLDNLKPGANKGKIEVYDDNEVYYVMNWTSRSRVSLKVIGKYKDELKGMNGKIITAEGKIIYQSQWSGTIDVTSYKVVSQ